MRARRPKFLDDLKKKKIIYILFRNSTSRNRIFRLSNSVVRWSGRKMEVRRKAEALVSQSVSSISLVTELVSELGQ